MQKQNTQAIAAPTLPPARPAYILRGHAVPVHSLMFLNDNIWLLSGDADGWMVLWTLTTKRPVAIWQAHEGSILGLGHWGSDKLITHGRDSRLRVWNLNGIDDDQAGFSTSLPVEKTTEERKPPWLLHALNISTLNFCAFAGLAAPVEDGTSTSHSSFIVAVPGRQDSDIELYHLPSEKQIAMIPGPLQSSGRAGMVMALQLYRKPESYAVYVAAGYENGRACLYKQNKEAAKWEQVYSAQPHKEPILSLDMAPSLDAFFTSGADALVVKHPLYAGESTLKDMQTKHSGQQGLHVRSDGRILATAGWDARIRVYSAKTLKELAVLKWHKEGCYALDFAKVDASDSRDTELITIANQTVAQARERRVKATHWLAAGSKDGKISLWDIY